MGPVGPLELALVGLLVLVVFGPKKIPELGKSLGDGIGSFKKALSDAQSEVTSAVDDEDAESSKTPANAEESSK